MASKTRLLTRNLASTSPSRPSISISRAYHSYDRPNPPLQQVFTPPEISILSASLPHIPNSGFTHTTLSLGTKDAGYIDASTNLFPSGAFSLVHYHLVTQRLDLASKCTHILDSDAHGSGEKRPLGVGAKVKALTWERLMSNREIISRWQEALALIALPSNIPTSLSELASLSDEIWFLAGDTSVDTAWYTKRASLSTIYAATELFMTTDQSTNYADTKEFLDRRFKDVQVVGGAMGNLGQWAGFTAATGLNLLRSKGVRI